MRIYLLLLICNPNAMRSQCFGIWIEIFKVIKQVAASQRVLLFEANCRCNVKCRNWKSKWRGSKWQRKKNYNYFISLINKRSSWFVMLWIGCPRLAIDCCWRWLASLIIQLMKLKASSYIYGYENVRARSFFFFLTKERQRENWLYI